MTVNEKDQILLDLLQQNDANRAILYFATGLSVELQEEIASRDWCTQMNFDNTIIDAKTFTLVDWFRKTVPKYRAFFLWHSLCIQLLDEETLSRNLAHATTGKGFDTTECVTDASPLMKDRLFSHCSDDILDMLFDGSGRDYYNTFLVPLNAFYKQYENDIQVLSSGDYADWLVLPQKSSEKGGIKVTMALRHHLNVQDEPEIVILIDYMNDYVDKEMSQLVKEITLDYNCDSYIAW